MANSSIYNTMEFSGQQMNLLDDAFGLSADLFADDLITEGGILDLDIDGFLKHQSTCESPEDLLLSNSDGDSLGDEWMETVDFRTLLDMYTKVDDGAVHTKVKVKVEKQEPLQEGLKPSAFELLKALLTGQKPAKTELCLDLMQPAKPVETPAVISPVAEVPNLDFSGCDNIDMLLGCVDTTDLYSIEDFIQPEVSVVNDGVIEIKPQIVVGDSFDADNSYSVETRVGSPSSINDDMESVLSSSPTSPVEAYGFNTIDTNYLSDDSQSSSVKCIQVSIEDFTKFKSKSYNRGKSSSPYDSDHDSFGNKRLRKKMQNKNAATRYRVKKREEKETLQQQEGRLSDTNKGLREKVESLQREIQYMKELMNEINKAKKSNI